MMRVSLVVCAALFLTGCVSTGPDEPDVPVLRLDAGGIVPGVSQLRIDFGRAQVGVVDTVTRLLDEEPEQVIPQAACGAGPVTSVNWEDGLTLNFMDGNFMGWVNQDPDLPTVGDIRPGQARLTLPPVSFQVNSLGTEFALGEVFGILDETDTTVATTYSGVTCFFR